MNQLVGGSKRYNQRELTRIAVARSAVARKVATLGCLTLFGAG